jgi:hypothetical protein
VHLSERQIELYRRGSLSSRELLAVDDHIERCESCRLELARGYSLDAAFSAWRSVLGEATPGTPDSMRIRGWREALSARPRAALVAVLACAALLAGLAALPLYRELARWRAEQSRTSRVAEARVSELARLRQKGTHPRRDLVKPDAGAAIVVADGARRIELDARGRLRGLDDVSPAWQREVAAAVVTGTLGHPAAPANPQERMAALRGQPVSLAFSLLTPVATAVRAASPRFAWSPLPGAQAYKVTVVDARYRLVTKSGPLASTEWTPRNPLPRGAVYAWQVVARRNGKETRAPTPPLPEARFRVLSAAEDADLDRAERMPVRSHLLLAVLDARAGLVGDAARELAALARLNPGSAVISRLTANLAAPQVAPELVSSDPRAIRER